MKIWIDDVRDAPDKTWTVVRSGQELATLIAQEGIISMVMKERPEDLLSRITHISFDHDLGEEENGYELAKWFIEFYELFPEATVPEMDSYSMNPDGRKNILSLIDSFKKSRVN